MCIAPGTVRVNKKHIIGSFEQTVACRKCPECLQARQIQWYLRMAWQSLDRPKAYFTTLTYSPENIPLTESGHGTLSRVDIKKHSKAWADADRALGLDKTLYYNVGEYGGKYGRPHYHQILFTDDRTTLSETWKRVEETWEKGRISVSEITAKRLMYVAKYSDKRLRNRRHHDPETEQRVPEFSMMSNGIGLNYLTDDRKAWHKANDNLVIWDPLNLKFNRLPQYYIDRIWTTPVEHLHIRAIRQRSMERHQPQFETFEEERYYEWQRAQYHAKLLRDQFKPSDRDLIEKVA